MEADPQRIMPQERNHVQRLTHLHQQLVTRAAPANHAGHNAAGAAPGSIDGAGIRRNCCALRHIRILLLTCN